MQLTQAVTAAQIAEWTHAELIGTATQPVLGINEIHNVQAGDLTFVDHPKYYEFTLKSAATVILINQKMEAPQGKTLLYHPQPFEAYNQLAQKFKPELRSQAAIAPGATIHASTFIYPNAVIGEGVTIGANCVIHPNATIYPYTVIGNNVIVHANTTIGADAFYYKKQAHGYDKMHSAGRVVIADDVEIGPGCTIDAGVSSDTYIGRGTKLDSQVHIGHDVKIGEHCILAAQVGIAGNTKIGNRVILYGKVAVNKNITIADDTTVMAMSAVPNNLEGGKTYIGYPVVEARTFARQVAIIKKLPELWDKLKQL